MRHDFPLRRLPSAVKARFGDVFFFAPLPDSTAVSRSIGFSMIFLMVSNGTWSKCVLDLSIDTP
jgi:hypothetical protein